MFLKKFIYINWGNIPATEFEFGPINLLSGGNGSGKTTAADAIQTIMTAAHDTLFHYNPGQDEATQRGRGKNVRTLASYVLGCDDGSYARPNGAVGYLAAVFYPTQGESGDPFTAIIGVSATVDRAGGAPVARQNDIQFFIVAGEELSQNDFLLDLDDSHQEVIPLGKLTKNLARRINPNSVEKYDTKKQYLRRLYGALRGRNDAVPEREAMNAARTFSRFMAYKPVKSINGFVANEILEAKDMGDAIRSVSDLMLSGTRDSAGRYIDQWIDYNVLEYTAARSRYLNDQKNYLNAKEIQQQIRESLTKTQKERDVAQDRRKQVREQLISMEARRQGIDALQDKDAAEQAINDGKAKLQQQAIPLLEQDQMLQASLRATELLYGALQKTNVAAEIPSLGSKRIAEQAREVLAIKDNGAVDFRKLLGKDWIDLSPLEAHLDDARAQQSLVNSWRDRFHDTELESSGVSLRDQIARVADRRDQKLQQAKHRMVQKQNEISALEARQATYPGYVRQALEAIMRECPQAEPRVLADYVEVTDPDWQSAIEGYIGGARFSILVESAFEAEAAHILRQIPGGSRARVIQGEKAKKDSERMKIPANSIIHLMDFEHATARYYLEASYGTVEQVADIQALRMTRRGVTKEGLGSGAYSIYRCDLEDADLVFGLGARERALAAKRSEVNMLEDVANEANYQLRQAQQLLDAVNLLRHVTFADQMQSMLDTQYQMQQAENSLQGNITEHNQTCQTIDSIVYSPDYRDEHGAKFFTGVCDLQREVERVHNRLKNNILVEKQDKLHQLRESFNNVFVTNLCHSIYQAINDGKRILEDLNKELAHHQFGADRETYWFDWEWVPEYKEYFQFFDEVIKNPSLGDGATLFTADSVKVRDHLMNMLLDEDEQKAMRELERLSDYRNYRSYEIYKQPANKEPIALSQYGTGSGGQLETPAYIIRSAAITSAFRFNEGDTHLRIVLVDEAFSKMDEARSKEVINYLTESLGLQLLFIMPTSKSGPFMDLVSNQFVFSKVPLTGGQKKGELQTRVLVDRQQCNQEKVKELWANHRRTIRHQASLDFMEEFA